MIMTQEADENVANATSNKLQQSDDMEEKPRIIKKQDIILALALIIIAAAIAGGYYLTHREPARRAEVSVGGEVVATLDLDKDQDVTIFSYDGGHNHLTVENGQIWCDEATCPDKVCIEMGKQYLDGSLIVCLPNSFIVKIFAD